MSRGSRTRRWVEWSGGAVRTALAALLLTACGGALDARADAGAPDDRGDADAGAPDVRGDADATTGARIPACGARAPELRSLGVQGFEISGAMSASVVGVSPDELRLSVGAQASPVSYRWAGPPLPFVVGEAVTLQRRYRWDIVSGARATAYAAGDDVGPSPIGPSHVPGGPTWERVAVCSFSEMTTPCGPQPGTAYALEVTLGGQTLRAEPGATVTLGAWQMTNAANSDVSSVTVGMCHAEGDTVSAMTMLGPAMP